MGKKDYASEIKLMNDLIKLHEEAATKAAAMNQTERQISELYSVQATRLEVINELKRDFNNLTVDAKKELITIQDLYNKEQVKLTALAIQQKDIVKQVENEKKGRENIVNILKFANQQLKIGWGFLMQSDKTIKTTILNLGLSGTKAAQMRLSFEQSAGFAAGR